MKRILLLLCMAVMPIMTLGQSRDYGAIMVSLKVTTGKATVTVTFEENQEKYASHIKNEKGEEKRVSKKKQKNQKKITRVLREEM